MGENIVERLARIIDPVVWHEGEYPAERSRIAARQAQALGTARRAIAALREPSDAMIEAAERTGSSCCGSDLSGPEIERLIWTSMIDTALTEGNEG